ncbi:MAG TPA: hypothetical protein VEQ41_00870, partial [Solirubrobacterales bacterium]|nr:hypothetical protein [Solirubrobacterales bacterium]
MPPYLKTFFAIPRGAVLWSSVLREEDEGGCMATRPYLDVARRDSAMARHRQRGRLRSPLSLLAVALLGFCLAVGASAAFASEGVPDYGPGTTLEQLEQGIDPAAPNILDEPTTNPQAAQELPHDDLGRAEALDLMTSVFSPTLERTAGVFGELDGARLLSTNVAVVDASSSPEGGASPGSVLLESAVPLSADGSLSSSEIVSLDLEHAQEELQPENPLVEVGIPGELGEGISLPAQQVTIDVPGAPSERGPSTISDSSAFYPNVAADTDIVVAPTPTGVETFSQLRTPDAPQNLQFDLELPQGATLEATEEGGAVVRDGDEIQVLIHPPTALDANGADIPVELSVAGHSILLEVSPSVDAAYPILVDPLYETFDWEKHYGGENYDWAASHVPMPGWVAE